MTRSRRASAPPTTPVAMRLPALGAVLMAPLVAALLAAPAAVAADRVETLAGSGTGGFAGDGGFAIRALLTSPSDVSPFAGGEGYLIADTSNSRIRRVDAAGVIETVAGAGPCCGTTEPYAGSGVAATDPTVRLNQPRGVAALPDGGFLIADTGNHRIRRVGPDGIITNVAGNGRGAFSDNDNATLVSVNSPGGVAPLPDGGFLIADTGNNRIRRVLPGGIRMITVAGNSFSAALGDGGQATAAALSAPSRVVALPGGGYLIADTGHNRIRRVGADGVITTVAGSAGTALFSGDGGPATAATLNQPEGVAVRDDGSIVIADTGNERIREVSPAGIIHTIAGNGTLGLGGDGGPPAAAQLSHPRAVAVDGGRMRIADSFNHRVRGIVPVPAAPGDPPPPPSRQPLEPTRVVPPGVAPPLVGRSTVVAPVSGTILVRLPGTRRFVALDSVENIPLGSELDARDGRVRLLFTTTSTGRKASAVVSGGRFVVRQDGRLDRGQLPGTLVLSGPLEGCGIAAARPRGGGPAVRRGGGSGLPRGAAPRLLRGIAPGPRRGVAPGLRRGAASFARPRAAAAAKGKRGRRGRKGRRINVDADGRIRTQGRYGAAIVRGTRWTIVDRCPRDPRPGTFVSVTRGKVAVTAFALRRTVVVRAGRRFLAPARRPRRAP